MNGVTRGEAEVRAPDERLGMSGALGRLIRWREPAFDGRRLQPRSSLLDRERLRYAVFVPKELRALPVFFLISSPNVGILTSRGSIQLRRGVKTLPDDRNHLRVQLLDAIARISASQIEETSP
jgi:hypothetical protein